MKRALISLAFVLLLLTIPAFAQENPFGKTEDYLPNEVYDYLTKEDIADLEAGRGDAIWLFSRLTSLWNTVAPNLTKSLCQILGMLILFGTFRALRKENLASDGVFSVASTLAFALYLYTMLQNVWQTCYAAMTAMHRMMTALTPTVTALYLLGGNATTASVQASLLAWFLGVMQQLLSSFFLPMLQLLTGFVMLGHFCDGNAFFTLTQRLRRGLTWAVGIFFGIFALVLGYQTSITQAADKLTARGLKFAFGAFLPFAGGALAESVRTLLSSLSLLKSVAGTVGILCVLMAILPPLVMLLCHLAAYAVLGIVADWFGCQKESALLTQMGEILKFLVLFLIAHFLFFLFFLTLFARSQGAYAA